MIAQIVVWGHLINTFLKELLTTLLISFHHFILISLSLQYGMTSFYSSPNSYKSITSHPYEVKDFTEIELAEKTPKRWLQEKWPFSLLNSNSDIMGWFEPVILSGSKILHRESGYVPAKQWATAQNCLSDPKMLSIIGKPHWNSCSDHQLLRVLMSLFRSLLRC